MAKFTIPKDLLVDVKQSIRESSFNESITELGTKTLDNRDYWENNNFNESTLKPYLTDNKETLQTELVDGIVYKQSIGQYPETYAYSIDALPFVINPKTRDIIRLDNYYQNNTEEYQLASEGKINYYIYQRTSGRPTAAGHIDNYQFRDIKYKFDSYADTFLKNGYYIFKLNWGDDSEIEYTDKPKLLESSVLFEHTYKKPGFYTISGVVYAADLNGNIGGYERFETKILLNPSQNYELNLYDYDNFATIGGISKDSVLVKSAVNLIGIDPLTFNEERAIPDVIKDVNLFDSLQILDFLNKILGSNDGPLINFQNFMQPFTEEFQQQVRADEVILGCMNSDAYNHNENANEDDGSCLFDVFFNFILPADSQVFLYDRGSANNWDNIKWDYTIPNGDEYDFHEDTVYNSGTINSFSFEPYGGPYSLNTMEESNTFIIINITNLENTIPLIDNNFELSPLNFTRRQQDIWERDYENGWYKLQIANVNSPSANFNGIQIVNITTEGESSGDQDDDILEDIPRNINLTVNNDDDSSNSFASIVNEITGPKYTVGQEIVIRVNFNTNHYLESLTFTPTLNFGLIDSGDDFEKYLFTMIDEDIAINAQVSLVIPPPSTTGRIGVTLESTNNNYGLPNTPFEFGLNSDNPSQVLQAIPEIDTQNYTYSFDKWKIFNTDYMGFGNNRTQESQNLTPTVYWKEPSLPDATGTIQVYFTRTPINQDGGGGGGGEGGDDTGGGGKRPGDQGDVGSDEPASGEFGN